MHYWQLITDRPVVWSLFIFYLLGTSYLAWLGHKKTKDIGSFAVGDRNMNPLIVGLTLAASIASTATFVINPGFVYVHGLSAFLHLGVAAVSGIVAGLYLMSRRFRAIGAESKALTLPQWIGQRFNSRGLQLFFALANLLSLTFVVLILGGVSIVMQKTLGLGNLESLTVITVFVFGYIFVGGTYAHAYTNTMQSVIMLVVALAIVGSGLHHFSEGPSAFFAAIHSIDPQLTGATNAATGLFDSIYKVYIAGFLIGFALVCQPHIMSKALYVKDDKAVKQYLAVTVVATLIFTSLLIVGFYVRLGNFPLDLRQDAVMTAYVSQTFDGPMLAIISVALLAAGMSTLDGILVSLSSIAANDIFLRLAGDTLLADRSEEDKARIAHRASQIILLGMGVAAFLIALHPPKLLGIFGQVGVYGLAASSTVPVLFGVFSVQGLGPWRIGVPAASAMGIHFGLYLWGGIDNPAVSASIGLIVSLAMAGLQLFLLRCTKTDLTPEQSEPSLLAQ